MAGDLDIKPWLLNKIVLPQSTDHAGVMWHGSYLLWLEEARINALSDVGLSYKYLSDQGYELPVVDLRIKYIMPFWHGEDVLLKTWISSKKGLRWNCKTKFLKDSGDLGAIANIDLVLVEKKDSGHHLLRKKPSYLSQALFDLQHGPNS
ncbi:4-hydroxybenzoyl-CoA thioesterase family active site [Prochlorococcus sp. MIT 0602]|nr:MULTISPECIES: acyl-CoA thioesterase [unclassified Prochlorococcus]KGG16601.1 4-hydroxybenzoyl-CoA thioesterase family active site [Prochlorococcus sp. MIT 0602]KGG18427.1 4-hydroxybenzoyl-CoA thioesterase family active site [Prochlorococcus sp. MIT 0603]